MLEKDEIKQLKDLCRECRENIVSMVHCAKSGHCGGALSAVEILTVLYQKSMKVFPNEPKNPTRDRFILSKGHASAVLYSVLAQRGFFPKSELMTFRKLGSKLQGHPNGHIDGVEVATGSLGQGLSIGCGMALGLKLDKNPAHVFVYMGDGECQEGSVWEGFMNAPQRKLDNIIAIIDRNRLQIDGCTENIKGLDPLPDKLKAFNWKVYEIDGHNLQEIYDTIEKAKSADCPVVIVANTIKGKGVSFMENQVGWHGKAPNDEEYSLAIAELKGA